MFAKAREEVLIIGRWFDDIRSLSVPQTRQFTNIQVFNYLYRRTVEDYITAILRMQYALAIIMSPLEEF